MNGVKMTLGSLFDGIAGFPLAAKQNGIETVWASEIEEDCIEIAKYHFPDVMQLGDIREIKGEEFLKICLMMWEWEFVEWQVAKMRLIITLIFRK